MIPRIALSLTLAVAACVLTSDIVRANTPEDECAEIGPPGHDAIAFLTDCLGVPLAPPPVLVGPMYAEDDGFTVALVDQRSPHGTVYKLTAFHHNGTNGEIVSDWSPSRCRRLEGLQYNTWYRLEAVARSASGFETEPVERWVYLSGHDTWDPTPPDDPWLVDRIDEVVDIYSLTDQARAMIADIPIKVHRHEPGYAGYWGPNRGVGIGHATSSWTLSHEVMHAFWEHWDGFPLPCDEMNIYTFRRDLVEFVLAFKAYDDAQQENPWEAYRPYYDNLIADFSHYSGPNGETAWQLLAEVFREGGHFRADIWNLMYHLADTEPPMLVSGKVHLVPPSLRRYFERFIQPVQEAEPTTWIDELTLYSNLAREDLWLKDFVSRYYNRLNAGGLFLEVTETPTSLPEPFRTRVRGSDRQALVDFVNTLEDMSCNTDCEEIWNAAPDFWTWHTRHQLIRMTLYTDEIGLDTGIELEESNWNAVQQALEELPACGETGIEDARELISSLAGIAEAQRAALLQVLAVREETWWLCEVWGGADGNQQRVARGIGDWPYMLYDLRTRGDTLETVNCGPTSLYEKPPLDPSKRPCEGAW